MKRQIAFLACVAALGLGGVWFVLPRAGSAAGLPAAKEHEAEAAPKMATSRITHVTIYPDSALVTREVEVPAGAGLMEVVVNPLPVCTLNSSLYSEGSDGVRVLSTRFRTRPVFQDTREEVRKLEDDIEKFQQTAQKLTADVRAASENMQFLTRLETFASVSTTHATEKGKLDSDATIALAKYVMEGRTERTRELVGLQQSIEQNNKQMQFAQRKLSELTAGTSKTERDAVVIVDKVNAGPAKIRLNYLVGSAAWKPQYKFRSGKEAKDTVGVEYLAGVTQQTGEDWSRVEVTLSTAQPMLNAAPPDLGALAVAVVPRGAPMPAGDNAALKAFANANKDPGMPGQPMGGPGHGMGAGGMPGMNAPVPFSGAAIANPVGQVTAQELAVAARGLRQRAQLEANTFNEAKAAEITNYAAALDQARDLVLLDDKKPSKGEPILSRGMQQTEGPSVTYHLANALSIPSRNDDQVIEVARLELTPDYFYKAVPVLTSHVYRQANLTNKSKYVLLPGEATMYTGNDFVGRMKLPLVAIGEEFTVGFGAEPQLQVTRQMMDKSRTMQGGNQILNYQYRILVSSYKPEKVRVQVWDRLPVAENEAMGVSLVKQTPELCKDPVYVREDRPNNLLRWDLDVEPEMKGEKAQKISYEFKLELDKQATIGSFQSK
jgi:Domain of unknown function (DUF4139)/N-terminal domain of unknown function (DUF4140)